ncbi:tRNA pseudouridine(55) synthase TruB [Brachyspira catarrhinii]|uniref:tRNA pseudouridine synthase B n=1 Tax=Brachyspira catarrhinii TaxID=2528966 RepID=A0ABY2TTU2_9SPIR|nr:tRNA pseudouridine(55) synthase TruB [Brachyspira catarrhinii]TKZ36276.1 tRNA pseudouridine(55) synthase TruB [Brachyspira catarrhinii]
MKGFLIVNKPAGITSFDAIKKIRRILREKKIGHVGTLDPFAEGVLILALGRYTKLFFLFDDMPKEYIAVGVFGESRDTDDINGNILKVSDKKNILSFVELENIIKKNFYGNIIQKPPIYSAKRINGRRAYNMARENIDFEIKNVNVRINDIELLEYDFPFFKIKTSVSKGTYIRAIIRDIGEITGNFAYTKELRRTAIGNFTIDKTQNLNDISNKNILSFFEMFENVDKKIIENENIIKQILCGNTKTIENFEISNKYLVLTDKENNLIALIGKKEENKDNRKNKNIFAFINS